MIVALLAASVVFDVYKNPIEGPLPPCVHLEAGAPGYGGAGNHLLIREGYAVLYSDKYKVPLWSQEQLDANVLATGKIPRKDKFARDPDLPKDSAKPSDYAKSGYDQGHMTPCGDVSWPSVWHPENPIKAQNETFYMSNMVPQSGDLNRQMWRLLEDAVRDATSKYTLIQVITGPVFGKNPKTIGKGKVSVPAKVYKIVVVWATGADRYTSVGYEMPNAKPTKSLKNYIVTIDRIEKDTGLDFFTDLPDPVESKMEAGKGKLLALPDIKP